MRVTLPPPWDAPVGFVTWPWILPVGATLAGAGVWASAGRTAIASNPIQSEIVRFMFFSLGALARQSARMLDRKKFRVCHTSTNMNLLVRLDALGAIRLTA